jgi:predicted DNA-binding helix-hairpin-helix protein
MAVGPGGRRFPLVKALLTTACERDCYYCAFRAGRDEHRVTFRPDEFARTFDAVHRAGAADGLFLSTGVVAGGANTQNRLLDTAEILRTRLGYRGYLHLKIMPGAEWGQVFRAMQLADRVSINLEAPGPARLLRLAPHKRFTEELLAPLRWAETIRRDHPAHLGWRGRWPSSTTQFVVGAAGEADVEILTTVGRLNRTTGLARAYFEAFHPVAGTPLENLRAEDPLRQHRLYQASFLLRDYGFDVEELPFGADGRLPLDTDPKDAFARNAFSQQPVDIHRADRETLLRVPGIGPRGATAILNARRQRRLRGLDDLRRLGVLADRAAPYITLDGRPRPRPRQLTLHGMELAGAGRKGGGSALPPAMFTGESDPPHYANKATQRP